jgi:transposase
MEETGEYDEQQLNHSDGEAERFYRDLQQRGTRVRIGMEATGYSRWFERLLAELIMSYGSGIPPRSRPSESRSGRPIAKMHDFC